MIIPFYAGFSPNFCLVTAPLTNVIRDFWPIANSCHLFDLITFIFGPVSILSSNIYRSTCSKEFSLNAHLKTELNCHGTIYGDFSGNVGWALEAFTSSRRFLLEPLEVLTELHGEFGREKMPIVRTPCDFKPGFLEMTRDFLFNKPADIQLPTLIEWAKQITVIEKLYHLNL